MTLAEQIARLESSDDPRARRALERIARRLERAEGKLEQLALRRGPLATSELRRFLGEAACPE